MIRPFRQSVVHFAFVSCAIIDASNASLVTTDVIKDSLDDVRLYAKLGHLRCSGAPKVMQAPGLRDVQAPV